MTVSASVAHAISVRLLDLATAGRSSYGHVYVNGPALFQ